MPKSHPICRVFGIGAGGASGANGCGESAERGNVWKLTIGGDMANGQYSHLSLFMSAPLKVESGGH